MNVSPMIGGMYSRGRTRNVVGAVRRSCELLIREEEFTCVRVVRFEVEMQDAKATIEGLIKELEGRAIALVVGVAVAGGPMVYRWVGGTKDGKILRDLIKMFFERTLEYMDLAIGERQKDQTGSLQIEHSLPGTPDELKTTEDVIESLLEVSTIAAVAVLKQDGSRGVHAITCFKGSCFEAMGLMTHLKYRMLIEYHKLSNKPESPE